MARAWPTGKAFAIALAVLVLTPLGESSWSRDSPTRTTFDGDDLPDERFGKAVAIDGNLIVAAANREVRIYEAAFGGWIETVMPRPAGVPTTFGFQVDVSDNIVAVSAPAPYGASPASAVVVYEKVEPDSWHMTILRPSTPGYVAKFGHSLASDGDRILVGGFSPCVCIWLFERESTGTWSETEIASSSGNSGGFGTTVAMSGGLVVSGDPAGNMVHAFRHQDDGTWREHVFRGGDLEGCCEKGLGMSLAASGSRIFASSYTPFRVTGTFHVFQEIDGGSWATGHKIYTKQLVFFRAQMDDDKVLVAYNGGSELYRVTETNSLERIRWYNGPHTGSWGGTRLADIDAGSVVVGGPFFDRVNTRAGRVYLYSYDLDGDGLTNHDEVLFGTDPANADTDADGLMDGPEVDDHETDPLNPDTDGDGLTDGDEVHVYGTWPRTRDTDNDFWGDGTEVACGSDPTDWFTFPLATCALPDEIP